MKLTRYLIIRNGHDLRAVVNLPPLDANEVAVQVTIDVPQPPRSVARIDITLPEPPPAFAEATVLPYPDEGDE